jgi:hypothetical protein
MQVYPYDHQSIVRLYIAFHCLTWY